MQRTIKTNRLKCPPELLLTIEPASQYLAHTEWEMRYSPSFEWLAIAWQEASWTESAEPLGGLGARPSLPDIWEIATYATEKQCDLEREFNALAREWRKNTRHVSSVHEKSMNRAYQKIIRRGKDFVPFILQDLERTRDHWLWALDIIGDENPAEHAETFEEAVDAWLRWGKLHGHLK